MEENWLLDMKATSGWAFVGWLIATRVVGKEQRKRSSETFLCNETLDLRFPELREPRSVATSFIPRLDLGSEITFAFHLLRLFALLLLSCYDPPGQMP